MLTAEKARELADSTNKNIKETEEEKALKELDKLLPDILRRIEEAVNNKEGATYRIKISNEECYYIQRTRVLQELGYQIKWYTTYPFESFISWEKL